MKAAHRKNQVPQGTTDALEIFDELFVKHDPEMQMLVEKARRQSAIGGQIYKIRKAAGLTQKELAKKVGGTSATVISRLENADYRGHSLTMLERIAKALGKTLDVEFKDPDEVCGGLRTHIGQNSEEVSKNARTQEDFLEKYLGDRKLWVELSKGDGKSVPITCQVVIPRNAFGPSIPVESSMPCEKTMRDSLLLAA